MKDGKIFWSIPASNDQVTLKQFLAYKAAKSEVEKVKAATGLSGEEVLRLKQDSINESIILFDTLADSQEGTFKRIIKFGADRLGFIPDWNELTWGENSDILANVKKVIDDKDYTAFPALMAILYRPITEGPVGDHYLITEYDTRTQYKHMDKIMQLDMATVWGAMLFFWTFAKELSKTTIDSSLTLMDEALEILTKNP